MTAGLRKIAGPFLSFSMARLGPALEYCTPAVPATHSKTRGYALAYTVMYRNCAVNAYPLVLN